MEGLNKTQLILLALLVSFVTSIATGIVTVALMDQAPPGVTQTINRVVEKTERIIVPGKTETVVEQVIIKEEDLVLKTVDKNAPNLVQIGALVQSEEEGGASGTSTPQRAPEFVPHGTGFIVSAEERIAVVQSSALKAAEAPHIRTFAGDIFPVTAAHGDIGEGFAFVEIADSTVSDPKKKEFVNTEFVESDSITIGQSAIALGLNGGLRLSSGVVSYLAKELASSEVGTGNNAAVRIETTAELAGDSFASGPLLTTSGYVMGVIVPGERTASALSIDFILAALDKIRLTSSEEEDADGAADTEEDPAKAQ